MVHPRHLVAPPLMVTPLMQDNDEILTAKELASQLKVSVEWVRDHALGRRLPLVPSIRLGGRRGLLRFQ